MLLFSCLTLGATLVLPRRDCTRRHDRRNPVSARRHAAGLLDGESAGVAGRLDSFHSPFLFGALVPGPSWRPRAALLLSSLALGAGDRAHLRHSGHAHFDRSI